MLRLLWHWLGTRGTRSSARRRRKGLEVPETRLAGQIEVMEERLLLSAAAGSDGLLSHEQWRTQTYTVGAVEASTQLDVTSETVEAADVQSSNLIGLPQVFDSTGYRGSGYSVAIIDTGIDYNHASLGGGWGNRVIAGYDFYNNDNDPMDDNGHGTHVAGIVGSSHATYTGIAPDVNLIALKVLGANGSGSFGAVEDALGWVIANQEAYNIVSVNMSFGAGNYSSNPYSFLDDEFSTLKDAGVFLAAASGNSFYSRSSRQGLAYPAISDYTVSVGAVWDASVGSVSWSSGARDYSTAADRITSFTQRSSRLDILAPGALLTNTYVGGGFATLAGTSMASPVIAGAAALLHQAADDTGQAELGNQDDLLTLMQQTGVTVNDGDDENDNVVNTGLNFARLDLWAAISALLEAAAPPVESSFDPATGQLTVTALEGTGILISAVDGMAEIRGGGVVDDSIGAVPASQVQSIVVVGSAANDAIDLSGVTASAFDGLDGVTLLGGSGNDTLIGSEFGDFILAGSGNDSVRGGSGDDLINAQGGNDVVWAGPGNDHMLGGAGRDYLAGGDGRDFIRGQGGSDTITGDAGNDTLLGNSGHDFVAGGTGNDILKGGTGHDILIGGRGHDGLDGGAGNDFINAQGGNDTLVGGGGNDALLGGAGRDILLGGAGDDRLNGQGGRGDTLAGGAGDDRVYNPTGADVVDESFRFVADWIDAA